MLGAAGVLFQNLLDVLNAGGPAGQVPWFEAGAYKYFAPPQTLFIAQLFLFAFVEARRYQDYVKPGSANQGRSDCFYLCGKQGEKRCRSGGKG